MLSFLFIGGTATFLFLNESVEDRTPTSLAADEVECAGRSDDTGPLTHEDMNEFMSHVIDAYLPKLKGLDLETIMNSMGDEYFLDTRMNIARIMHSPENRQYCVRVNPTLLPSPPKRDAMVAIMAHELSHIRKYSNMGSVRLLAFMASYGLSERTHLRDEHQMDEEAMKMGLGEGLIEYRCWLWRRLTPAQWKKKAKIYYSPSEIRQWMQSHPVTG